MSSYMNDQVLVLEIDSERIYSVNGIRFAGVVLNDLTRFIPVGATFRIVSREPDGVLAIERLEDQAP